MSLQTIHSLGVMTGTSCDGADAAVLAITESSETLVYCQSESFPSGLRRRLREAQRGAMKLRALCFLERDYSDWIAAFCAKALHNSNVSSQSTICAVHGQTIWHEPPHFSVQLLEPSRIAVKTGITTVARFRQPDLALGGQGAPFAPYYHWLRAHALQKRFEFPFAVQNLGGISNLTVISMDKNKTLAFDTGPANALIDLAMEHLTHGKKHFDANGAVAASAEREIQWKHVERLARLPYFRKRPPKSTGRELFNEAFLMKIPGSGATRVANATALSAHSIAAAYRDFVFPKFPALKTIYLAGGGAKNKTFIRILSSQIRTCKDGITIAPLPDFFGPPAYLEAMAFARLGYEALLGRAVSLSCITGAAENSVGAAIVPGKNFSALLRRIKLIQKK